MKLYCRLKMLNKLNSKEILNKFIKLFVIKNVFNNK